jgi:hypothetical protein
VGHSLGGMFALWHAAAGPGRIASLVIIGEPAVALPGTAVRMPLSLLTVPVLGHGPWLEDPAGCAKLVTSHLAATGFAPAWPPTMGHTDHGRRPHFPRAVRFSGVFCPIRRTVRGKRGREGPV